MVVGRGEGRLWKMIGGVVGWAAVVAVAAVVPEVPEVTVVADSSSADVGSSPPRASCEPITAAMSRPTNPITRAVRR